MSSFADPFILQNLLRSFANKSKSLKKNFCAVTKVLFISNVMTLVDDGEKCKKDKRIEGKCFV